MVVRSNPAYSISMMQKLCPCQGVVYSYCTGGLIEQAGWRRTIPISSEAVEKNGTPVSRLPCWECEPCIPVSWCACLILYPVSIPWNMSRIVDQITEYDVINFRSKSTTVLSFRLESLNIACLTFASAYEYFRNQATATALRWHVDVMGESLTSLLPWHLE